LQLANAWHRLPTERSFRQGLSTHQEKSMEARCSRAIGSMAFAVVCCLGPAAGLTSSADAAGYRTANFTVSAPTPQLAKEIGDTAEMWRKQLAIEWLGEEMPTWSKSCPINAKVQPGLGAGGATSFVFDRGEVFGWRMNIQGTRERVLDSVLPHEVTHTIFASYFRQPLPRWADEGACTTVEHRSEIAKQERMLIDFLKTGRGIPFGEMFAMKEYPQDVLPLYSQGHSLAQWLIEARGKRVFLTFLADGLQDENWPRAVEKHYGFNDLYAMQNKWLDWVKQGRPTIAPGTLLASNEVPVVVRGQSPDDITPIGVTAPNHIPPAEVRAPRAESIYAAMAARARAQEQVGQASVAKPGSVYDASLGTGVMRR
jgi:hypothetical protein